MTAIDNAATATLANGGGTFDARTFAPVTPSTGYAVGVHAGTFATVAVVIHPTNRRAAIVSAIRRAADQALAYGAGYVGTWIDAGVIHVDPVTILEDRGVALRVAAGAGQLAVWSFADGESIELDCDCYIPAPSSSLMSDGRHCDLCGRNAL